MKNVFFVINNCTLKFSALNHDIFYNECNNLDNVYYDYMWLIEMLDY